MKQTLKALGFLAALLPSMAVAQTQLPTLPANTVLGRLGIIAGTAQAIPLSQLGPSLITNYLAVTAPLTVSGLNLSITGAVGKVSAGATGAFTATPQLGVASTTTGSVAFANSGNTGIVTVQAPSTATSWTFKWPTTAGSNGQALITDGSGNGSWAAGTGTVNSGTAGQLGYYATTAAALSGNANLTVSAGALTIGVAGTQAGTLKLSGATANATTLAAPASGGGTMTFPAGSDTVAGIDTIQTLTSKTLTSPTINTPTIAGGTHTAITSLGIRDTSAAFDVTVAATSTSAALTAGRALTLDMGNVAHTMQFGTTANTITFPSVASDTVTMLAATQAVSNKTITASTYNGLTVTSTTGTFTLTNGKTLAVSNSLTFTGTDGNSFAFPSGSDTVATLTASQTLTNKTLTAPTINGGTAQALTNLGVRSSGGGAFDMVINNTETLTAQRILTLTLNNAARAISLSGNLTLAADLITAGGNAITLTASGGTTNVTLPTSGTLAAINIAQTFSSSNIFSAVQQFTDAKFSSGKIYPTSDSTTALQITKADGTTRVMNFDTTNARVGINKTAGAFDLDVNGAVNVGTTLTFTTLDPTSLGTSTSTVTGLTVNNSPSSSNDYIPYYSAADGRIRKATVGSIAAGATAGVSSLNGLTGGLSIAQGTGITVAAAGSSVTVTSTAAAFVSPQHRITLTSATPVMGSSVSAATTVYVTPYGGNLMPVYDGTNVLSIPWVEVSQATTDTTKSPAAVAATKVYDVFCWLDTGPTNRCTRGPAWTNATTRGYTLTSTNGILLNTSAITNGPAALRGTWVGTIASNSGSTIDWIFGVGGTGGVAGVFNVWNAYNRVDVGCTVLNTGSSYTYTSVTIRQAGGSSGMQVSFVVGAAEDVVSTSYSDTLTTTGATGAFGFWGTGFDSITAFSLPGKVGQQAAAAAAVAMSAASIGNWNPGIGTHYVAALEQSDSAHANTFNTVSNAGLSFRLRM